MGPLVHMVSAAVPLACWLCRHLNRLRHRCKAAQQRAPVHRHILALQVHPNLGWQQRGRLALEAIQEQCNVTRNCCSQYCGRDATYSTLNPKP